MSNANSVFDMNDHIQKEYLELLQSIKKTISKENAELLLDEIQIFWKKREQKIDFILKWLSSEKYVISYFTCATVLDTSGTDYYSFLLTGDYHIFDDPVVFHLGSSTKTDGEFSEYLLNMVIKTIEDNIRILTSYNHFIWVIPIRFLYSALSTIDDIEGKVDSLFLSLFSNITSMDEYFSKCKSVSDIDTNISEVKKRMICLSENERKDSTFIDKMTALKNERTIKMLHLNNDAEIFYFQMKSYFLQSIDTLFTAINANMFPFIRYSPSFLTFQMVSKAFYSSPDTILVVSKSFLNFALYKSLDCENFKDIGMEKYMHIIIKEGYRSELRNFNTIDNNDINFAGIKSIVGRITTDIKDKAMGHKEKKDSLRDLI